MKQLIVILTLLCPLTASSSNRDLFTAFYPAPIVAKTLETFQVPTDTRPAIIDQLTTHELDVIYSVEQIAEAKEPNPLQTGDQSAVVELFNHAVLQVFTDVLKSNGVTDEEEIHAMLSDIHRQKTDRFRTCMETLPDSF